MRFSNGGPDAHDMLLDRPEGLVRAPEPKLTIEVPLAPGQDADLTSYGMQAPDAVRAVAAAREIEESKEYLEAEQDADYQIRQLNREAEHLGTSYLLGLAVSMVARAHEEEPNLFRSIYGTGTDEMLADVLAVEAALPNGRKANRIIIDQHAARNPSWLRSYKHWQGWRERFFADRGVRTGRA